MISIRGVTTTVPAPSLAWAAAMTRLLPEPVGAASSRFSPARAAGVPYAYNLVFAGPAGIISSLRRKVPAASLAATT